MEVNAKSETACFLPACLPTCLTWDIAWTPSCRSCRRVAPRMGGFKVVPTADDEVLLETSASWGSKAQVGRGWGEEGLYDSVAIGGGCGTGESGVGDLRQPEGQDTRECVSVSGDGGV